MATKDWKKTGKDVWKKGSSRVSVIAYEDNDFKEVYCAETNSYPRELGCSRMKSKAVILAKSYMRSH